MDSVDLDEFDRALLAQSQMDNQASAKVLAEQVGLSESAVLRRLRGLRRNGIIIADVSIVDPAVLGTPLTIHVLVSLEREGAAALDAFEEKVCAREEVQGAWYVAGEADFILLLRVRNMEAYEHFTREVFLNDPNIRAFRTIIALREVTGPKHRQRPSLLRKRQSASVR